MRVLLFFLLISLSATAQQAVVRGVAPLAIGEEIQLRVIEDPITDKERVIAKQKIAADGSFELKASIVETQYAFLQVGLKCADFYLKPGTDLELSFIPPPPDPKKPRGFNERQFFIPKITGGTAWPLNEQITAFNDSIDAFLESIYPLLKQRKSPAFVAKKVQQFEQRTTAQFRSADPFVKEYIKYAVANVEQTFHSDRDELFAKYLKNVKPQFNNPAYTDFMLQFFQGEVYRMAVVENYEQCRKLLGQKDAFHALDKMLSEQVPALSDPIVRRMVLIDGIDGLFGQKEFEDEKLIRALKEFGAVSVNTYLSRAALNLAAKHESMTTGTMAPEIVYRDEDGVEHRLSDNRGAYVFLELTDATNAYANRETNVIPHLKQEFRDIRFITICVGNDRSEMIDLKKRMNIDWELGRIERSSTTVDDYRIKSLPLFFIIDPDGKFYACPAKDPTKGAQMELLSLTEKLKAKYKGSVGK